MNASKDIAAMGAVDLDITLSAQQDAVEHMVRTNQTAPNAVIVSGYSGDPDTKGTLLVKALDLTSCKVGDYLFTAPRLAALADQQEPVWDGKLSDATWDVLNDLYLHCGHETASAVAFQVRKECDALYASLLNVKRMYHAAQQKLEALEATRQPSPASQAGCDGCGTAGLDGR